MGSVIAEWKGQCDPDLQNELLPYIARLAEKNLDYKEAIPEPLNPLSRKIRECRSGGRRPLAPVRTFDEVASGKVLLRTDIFRPREAGLEAAARCGAEILPRAEGTRPADQYFQLEEIGFKGLDFALFDAFGRYPGSDRLSFVFLQCPEMPDLHGRLVHVHDTDVCSGSTNPDFQTADWVLECPYIHLRYTHERWLDQLLSWIRFFFIPDLHYWRHDDMPGYQKWHTAYDEICRSRSRAEAIETTFDDLVAAFCREASQSVVDAHWT